MVGQAINKHGAAALDHLVGGTLLRADGMDIRLVAFEAHHAPRKHGRREAQTHAKAAGRVRAVAYGKESKFVALLHFACRDGFRDEVSCLDGGVVGAATKGTPFHEAACRSVEASLTVS